MGQSCRNQWQSVVNVNDSKRLNQAKTVATGCDQLPIGAHGKEGVGIAFGGCRLLRFGAAAEEAMHEADAEEHRVVAKRASST